MWVLLQALTCIAKSRDESTLALGDVSGSLHLVTLHACAPVVESDDNDSALPDSAVPREESTSSDYED